MKKIFFLTAFLSCCLFADDQSKMVDQLKKSSQYFMENKGQWDPDVLFSSSSNGMNLWILKGSVINSVAELSNEDRVNGHNIEFKFNGYNENFTIKKEGKSSYYFNYLYGENQATEVYKYNRVTLRNIYDNIDLVYYNKEGNIRYDFIVNPGGNPDDIQIEINGSKNIKIKENGNLEIATTIHTIEHQDLFVYQGNQNKVESSFNLKDNLLAFNLGDYDKNEKLVIDPILATCYSNLTTTPPGSAIVDAYNFNVDTQRNYYLAGKDRASAGNIGTMQFGTGIYQFSPAKRNFISKFDMNGQLLWCSYVMAGQDINHIYGLEVDLSNNPIVAGLINGNNITTTLDAHQSSFQGGSDGFILKLSNDGTTLLYSTFIGGSTGGEILTDIAVDKSNGNVYFIGNTWSTDFPLKNEYQSALNGLSDIVFGMLSPTIGANGYTLEFSTYFGGNSSLATDYGECITVNNNEIYIVGKGVNFPLSNHPYLTTGFGLISKFSYSNNNLNLVYSSYLSLNNAQAKTVEAKNGIVHIGGVGDIEITPYSYDNDNSKNGFYMKLATDDLSNTNDLIYSTYLYGVTDIELIESCDNVILSGGGNEFKDHNIILKDSDYSTPILRGNPPVLATGSSIAILNPYEYHSDAIEYLAYIPANINDIKVDQLNGYINSGGASVDLNNVNMPYFTTDGSTVVEGQSHITVVNQALCGNQDNCCNSLNLNNWYVTKGSGGPFDCQSPTGCRAKVVGNIESSLCVGELRISTFINGAWVNKSTHSNPASGDFSTEFCLSDGTNTRIKIEYYSDQGTLLCSKILPFNCDATQCCGDFNYFLVNGQDCNFTVSFDFTGNGCIQSAWIYVDKGDGNGFIHDQTLNSFNLLGTILNYTINNSPATWNVKVVFKNMLGEVVCIQEGSYTCETCCDKISEPRLINWRENPNGNGCCVTVEFDVDNTDLCFSSVSIEGSIMGINSFSIPFNQTNQTYSVDVCATDPANNELVLKFYDTNNSETCSKTITVDCSELCCEAVENLGYVVSNVNQTPTECCWTIAFPWLQLMIDSGCEVAEYAVTDHGVVPVPSEFTTTPVSSEIPIFECVPRVNGLATLDKDLTLVFTDESECILRIQEECSTDCCESIDLSAVPDPTLPCTFSYSLSSFSPECSYEFVIYPPNTTPAPSITPNSGTPIQYATSSIPVTVSGTIELCPDGINTYCNPPVVGIYDSAGNLVCTKAPETSGCSTDCCENLQLTTVGPQIIPPYITCGYDIIVTGLNPDCQVTSIELYAGGFLEETYTDINNMFIDMGTYASFTWDFELVITTQFGTCTLPFSLDGCAPFFPKKSFNQESPEYQEFGFQINPNPVNDDARLQFSTLEEVHAHINIFTIDGSFVSSIFDGKTVSGLNNFNFETSQLTPGVYFVNLNLEGQSFIIKFVKE